MPKPTKEQLKKINQLAKTELSEDQVYVFRNIALDTKPIKQYGLFGEYTLTVTPKTLHKLKKDFKTGLALLASHNMRRLPIGRTFDAEVLSDEVDGETVETLYIDNYIVTHFVDEDGNKQPIRTEVGEMTTQDIVYGIEAGHIFDTSITFSMDKVICSVCNNDIRSSECSHLPGVEYDIQLEDGKVEKRVCNIIGDGGEGYENSLVYSGAVDRATILSKSNKEDVHNDVNNLNEEYYNVYDIKKLSLNTPILCRLSKYGLEMFTLVKNCQEDRSETMAEQIQLSAEPLKETVAKEVYDEVKKQFQEAIEQNKELLKQLDEKEKTIAELQEKVDELKAKVADFEEQVAQLSEKAKLADQFTEDLIQETLKAGVQARGNSFNKDRFEKYLRTLSVSEIKEELEALRKEFPGSVKAARVTKEEVEEEKEEVVQMSKHQIRQLAAKRAVERHQKEGGDLEKLTKEEYEKLMKQRD